MAKLFDYYIIEGDDTADKNNHLEFPQDGMNYSGSLNKDFVGLSFTSEHALIAKNIIDHNELKCDMLDTLSGITVFFSQTDIKQSVKMFTTTGLLCDVLTAGALIKLEQTVEDVKKRVINGEPFEEIIEQQFVSEFVQTYDHLQPVPVYLQPLNKTNKNFLAESTSGNSVLFTHIQPLQSANYKKSEIERILKTINKYVLVNPVTDEELIAITSEDAFSEDMFFGEKGRFYHDVFGDYMLANSDVLKIDGQLHIYTRDKTYSNDQLEFEKRMLDKVKSLKDTQRKEVLKYINLQCRRTGENSHPKLIGLKNNILDIETMKTFPYSPEYIINNRVDYDYDPDAKSEVVDSILDKVSCHDKNLRAVIEEMIGYTLYRSNKMQITFFLTGGGSNGKSTILEMMQKMLGEKNYSALSLSDLEDKFKPADLYHKLANFGDDIGSSFFEASDMFKKMATGDKTSVQRKFGQPFDFSSYATLIYCANAMPPVNDRTDGFSRRMVIVPFNNTFSVDDIDFDPFIDEKSKTDEAIRYLLKLGVEGLKRLLYNKGVTVADACIREKAQFIKDNNPVIEWLETEPELIGQPTEGVYVHYCGWCSANGIKPLGLGKLSRELKKHANVETAVKNIKGFGNKRVYVELGGLNKQEQEPEQTNHKECTDTIGV